MDNSSENNLPTSLAVNNLLVNALDDTAQSDFDKSRVNITEVINVGMNALQTLADIADQSQHPGTYGALSKLMDTLVNANKALLNLHKEIRSIPNPKNTDNFTTGADGITAIANQTNIVMTGSTSDLQNFLKNMNISTETNNLDYIEDVDIFEDDIDKDSEE